MEKTKKSIFSKIFVCLSLCLVLLGALAPCFSMNKNQPLRADSVVTNYDFVGSDFFVPSYIMAKRSGSSKLQFYGTSFVNISFKFNVLSNSSVVYANQTSRVSEFDVIGSGSLDSDSLAVPKDNTYKYMTLFLGELVSVSGDTMIYDRLYVDCMALCNSSEFNNNIRSVVFGSYLHSPLNNIPSWFTYYNYVKYIDNNSNFIVFAFLIVGDQTLVDSIEHPDRFALDFRTYYLTGEFTNNDYYNQGYDFGYDKGYKDGDKVGYNSGYEAGNTFGYNNGYNQGLNDSNQYTFINLIGATIDAPIQYFKSLFNFELLGVNLSSFLLALFTLCVVITIVKLCLGR